MPSTPGRDDLKNPLLDPTIPQNIERIKNFGTLTGNGALK
jgi:hypothetical protein